MRNVTRVGVIVLTIVLATGLIGASSFTSATLTRDTNINVVDDTNGFIALHDYLPGSIVRQKSNGELTIDFTRGSATGVNVDSIYELGTTGWSDNSTDEQAFNITNNDDVSHTLTLNYDLTSASGNETGNGANETEFRVFDSTGTNVLTISEEGNGGTITLASGETVAVVVVVDTTDSAITSTEDLSGNFNVTA